jgi:hypothetical protein
MMAKKHRFYALIILFSLSISILPPLVYAPILLPPGIQLAEHDSTGAAGSPDCGFIFTNDTQIRLSNSFVGSRRGSCYAFMVFPANSIRDGNLSITWSGIQDEVSNIFVMDGIYERNETSWFPAGPLVTQGNGKLQDVVSSRAHPFAEYNENFLLNFNDSATGFVTLFIENYDNDAVQLSSTNILNMTVYNSAGSQVWQSLMSHTQFCDTGAPPDCRTGGSNDSGYLEDTGFDVCYGTGVSFPDFESDLGLLPVGAWIFTNTTWEGVYNFTETNKFIISILDEYGAYYNVSATYQPGGLPGIGREPGFFMQTNQSNPGFAALGSSQTGATNYFGHNETTGSLWIGFSIWFSYITPTSNNLVISQWCSDGVGWIPTTVGPPIIGQGGGNSTVLLTGNGTIISSGELFEVCTDYLGTAETNYTLVGLKHFGIQYAVRFYDESGTPEDQFMQIPSNAVGGETVYQDPGDYFIHWKWYMWDDINSNWVQIIRVSQSMIDGDEGADDEWTTHQFLFYDKDDVELKNEYMISFIEEEPSAKTRFWFDMWINKVNASSIMGARANAYYYGMINTPYLGIWSSWSPLIYNQTTSMATTNIMDYNGIVRSADYFQPYYLSKMSVELTRLSDASSENFQVCIEDINILDWQVKETEVPLEGVDTPIFNAPKVPDMPIGGMFAALADALGNLASWIVGALSAVGLAAWRLIEGQFPELAGFLSSTYLMLTVIGGFVTELLDAFVALFVLISNSFWIFGFIIYAIGEVWALISIWIQPFMDNPVEWAQLGVLLFLVLPFADALAKGDMGAVESDLRRAWGITSWLLNFSLGLANKVIGWIMAVIPF